MFPSDTNPAIQAVDNGKYPNQTYKRFIRFLSYFYLLNNYQALANSVIVVSNDNYTKTDSQQNISNSISLVGIYIPAIEDGGLALPPGVPYHPVPGKLVEIDEQNVYFPDDRIIPLDKYPEQTIGKVYFKREGGRSSHCTATLISEKHILTNGHCVLSGKNPDGTVYITDKWKESFEFLPNERDGGKRYKSASWKNIYYPPNYQQRTKSSNDWAIVELDRPVGKEFGWMGLKSYSYSYYENNDIGPVNLIGYSADHYADSPGAHYGCRFYGTVNFGFGKSVMHDCDSTGGSSGSGIHKNISVNGIVGSYIVALHYAHFLSSGEKNTILSTFMPSNANLAVATADFFDTVASIISNSSFLPPKRGTEDPLISNTIIYVMVVTATLIVGTVVYCVIKHKNNKTQDIPR